MTNILNIIKEAKEKASDNEKILEVIEALESLYELYSKRNTVDKNRPGECEAFASSVRETQERLRSAFTAVAATKGLTMAQFQELFRNPDYFAPQEWEQMQQVKNQTLEGFDLLPSREKGRIKKEQIKA